MIYKVVGVNPSFLSHETKGDNLAGVLPVINDEIVNPSVSAGLAEWKELDNGGLFNFYKKALIIESLSDSTWKIGRFNGTVFQETRTIPAPPFRLCPGEVLQATGTPKAHCIARLDTRESL